MAAAGSTTLAGAAGQPTLLSGKPVVFVGGLGSEPVWAYDLDPTSGLLSPRATKFDAGMEPSYLALDPGRMTLYVANTANGDAGGVTALHINSDASLRLLNHRQGTGGSFVHLMVSPNGRYLSAASYGGGSVSMFPLNRDGSVGEELSSLEFGGDARAHSVTFDLTGSYEFVATNGLNRVQQLRVGLDGKLSLNSPASVATGPNSGPRHVALHPKGQLAFVVNELGSSVTPLRLIGNGTLQMGTTVSSLPPGFTGENTGAHVELSPNGHFAYVSNRGHDSIAIFAADQSDGTLTLLEHESTRGVMPRDFDVDPNGRFLVVANMADDALSVYAIEPDGTLSPLGSPVPTRNDPCAVQFYYPP